MMTRNIHVVNFVITAQLHNVFIPQLCLYLQKAKPKRQNNETRFLLSSLDNTEEAIKFVSPVRFH